MLYGIITYPIYYYCIVVLSHSEDVLTIMSHILNIALALGAG